MGLPSFTLIFSAIFCVYLAYSMWSLAQIFSTLKCTGTPCYTYFLADKPELQLALFTSLTHNPLMSEVRPLGSISPFDYTEPIQRDFEVKIPLKSRTNGTLYLHAVLALNDGPLEWKHLQRDGPTVIQRVSLTDFVVPEAATFNLLGEQDKTNEKSKIVQKPVTHFKPKIYLSILVDNVSMSREDIPPEIGRYIRITRKNQFLPIVQNDFLKTRLKDLIQLTPTTLKLNLQFNYAPIAIGKLRLMLIVENALQSMKQFGFSRKDIDEVKGVFSDTNLYFLLGTIFVTTIHILFDFLSFKNDVAFWRSKKTYEGLSTRTILWRGFSQIIIFLYLLDEKSSLLILFPAGIATLIELWKCKKILKIDISMSGISFRTTESKQSEEETKAIDREAMRYLSYLLYPLCIAGAIYSLIYQPHKSWYSWTINSLVNGVYAFGFLFMLPQLFVNYKLKSVAALPWRAFMYKAFNTFIDDIFAFIITMPTAHRLACFRDDIVFLIYLYQRWLYPVDASRLDDGRGIQQNVNYKSQKPTSSKTSAKEKKKKK